MGSHLRVCAIGALVVGAGCSTGSSSAPVSGNGAATTPLSPRVPDMTPLDGDRNRIDDSIDAELRAGRDATIPVEAVFSAEPPLTATRDFEAAGGKVRRVLHGIGYGFTGRIARSAIATLVPKLGPNLLLMKAEQVVVPHLDESTRTSRARAVWQKGFAGSTSGFNGSSKVNIAIVDGGVDSSHPDLAGRLIGYKDYTNDGVTEPQDMLGHGTHVAGIALGSGAAFGVGPGTLAVTETGTDATLAANDWLSSSSSYHLPPTYTITSTATFEGTSTILSILEADDGKTLYTPIGASTAQTSPLHFTFDGNAAPGTHLTITLRQNAAKDVKRFAVASKITNYPAVGDGFPALRGVAPLSGYYAAKIFPVAEDATTDMITDALQDVYDLRESLDIKVVNCSFGIGGGGVDPAERAKVSSLVDAGVVVVASSGNNGPGGFTGDPGRTADAITVGATNDANQVAAYSSGASKSASDTDDKPDIVAPGGSAYRSKVLSVDSNWNDSASSTFADVQKDDYTSILGTSMAAPIVSGAAALVIQALESKGHVWDYQSANSSHLVKMLLLATATETNQNRESSSGNPSLGRATEQKDLAEGYGIVNIDAAIEAATLTWDFKDPLLGTTGGLPSDRRAWARKVTVPAGQTIKLALDVPPTADFDLYVYARAPSDRGTPLLQTSSARGGLGLDEEATWTFLAQTDLYVVVKRVAGSGTFTLNGATFTCGNGTLDPGEECDDGNKTDGDCCSAACQQEETPACGFPEPNGGVADAGADSGSDNDAGTDAGEGVDANAPPFTEPTPEPTPAPTATTPPVTAPTSNLPSAHVERLEAGGGGCSTSGGGASFGSLGLALACALIARRRRRIV